MTGFFYFLPVILCFMLSAAHFHRAGLISLTVLCLLFTVMLFWQNRLAARIIQLILVVLSLEWLRSIVYYTRVRIENGDDWLRLVIILSVVTLGHLATVFIFRTSYMKKRYRLR